MASVGFAPRHPMGAKDVGDLQTAIRGRAMRPWSAGRRSLRQLDAQPIQRTLDVADGVDGDAV